MDSFDDIQRPRLREAAVPLKSRAIHVYPLNCCIGQDVVIQKMKGDILFCVKQGRGKRRKKDRILSCSCFLGRCVGQFFAEPTLILHVAEMDSVILLETIL